MRTECKAQIPKCTVQDGGEEGRERGQRSKGKCLRATRGLGEGRNQKRQVKVQISKCKMQVAGRKTEGRPRSQEAKGQKPRRSDFGFRI